MDQTFKHFLYTCALQLVVPSCQKTDEVIR